MNYLRIYNKLITRAQNTTDTCVERHHIVPRCMGGNNKKSNIVKLSPEEHFFAHILLVKIYPETHGLILAVNRMCTGHTGKRNRVMYGWLRRRFIEHQSLSMTGDKNHQFGSRWINNGTVSKKLKLNESIPNDWVAGRVKKHRIKVDKRQLIKDATDKKYLAALLQSDSISSALRLLGLRTAGAGYARMKEVILKNNLQNKFAHEHITWVCNSIGQSPAS